MKYLLIPLIFLALTSCSTETKIPAKEIALEAIYNKTDGVIPTLKQLKGKIVVLDFWATWCAPCIEAFPKITAMHHKYSEQDVVFIGITNDPKEKLENFLSESDVPFWMGHDTDGSAFKDYGVTWIPNYVVINKKGAVVYNGNFFDEAMLKEVIETDGYKKEKSEVITDDNTSDLENITFYPGQDPAYLFAYKTKYGEEAPFTTAYSFVIRPSLYDKKIGSGISYNGKTTSITYPYCTLVDFIELSQDKTSPLWVETEAQDSFPYYDIIYAKPLSISDAYSEVEQAFLELTQSKMELQKKKKDVKKLVSSDSEAKLFTKKDLPEGTDKLYTSASSFLPYLEKFSGSIHVLDDALLDKYIPNASFTFDRSIYKATYSELVNTLSHSNIKIKDAQQELDIVIVSSK